MRVLLHLVERHGYDAANIIFLTKIDEKRTSRIDLPGALRRTIQGRIAYIGMVKGKEDLVYKALQDRWSKIAEPEQVSRYAGVRTRWRAIVAEPDAQRKGYMLESFLMELCCLEAVECKPSFKVDREQIDGSVTFFNALFLVECKATKNKTKLSEIDTLYGKLGRRPAGVKGIFISLSGFDQEVVSGVQEYGNKAIVLWTAQDIEAIIQERISFVELQKEKLYQLSIFRRPLWHLADGKTSISGAPSSTKGVHIIKAQDAKA
ncbi:MAG TPA: restriction endonuclease, partial [Fimbriimonas sp.]|nr:restriction endonuclease [Fimbriimonas sp.]